MEASREFSRTPPHLPPCSDVSVLQKTRMSHFLDTPHTVRSRPILSSDRPLRHEKLGPLALSCGLNGCHKGCLRMENDRIELLMLSSSRMYALYVVEQAWC